MKFYGKLTRSTPTHAFKVINMFENKYLGIAVSLWSIVILGVLIAGIFTGNGSLYRLAFLLLGMTFSLIVFEKGREFGFDTVRGRFFLIAVPVGLIIGLAVALENPVLHLIFRILMLTALIFMFYNLKFRLGAPLKGSHLTISTLLGIMTLILMAAIMHQAPLRNWFTISMAAIDTVSLILIILNLTMYMGGEIAKEWLFRSVSIIVLIMGDIAYLLNIKSTLGFRLELLLWFLPFFLMGNVLIYAE